MGNLEEYNHDLFFSRNIIISLSYELDNIFFVIKIIYG